MASAKSIEKSVRKLQSWYLDKPPEEQTLRRAIAWTFNAVSKHALDPLKAQASTAMPLVFFASHAQPEEGEEAAQSEAAIWSEVWTEVTPGMEQGIHLYLKVRAGKGARDCVEEGETQDGSWKVGMNGCRDLVMVPRRPLRIAPSS